MNPEISVITTVYNCEKYISESIESIRAQTFGNFEHIIINDGSTDNTPEVIERSALKDKRIIFINNKINQGRVNSLNEALESARGKYIAIQDADDISLPERFDKQIAFLNANPDYALVGSDITVIDGSGNIESKPVRPHNDIEIRFSLLFRCTLANASVLYRTRLTKKFNIRYEKDLSYAEDFRIFSLISKHGKLFNLKDRLILYRAHESNSTSSNQRIIDIDSVEVRGNLVELGFTVNETQVRRIRNLISSRGIDKEHLLSDISMLFKIIKQFQKNENGERNEEVLKALKRMSKWLGKKNTFTKPAYLRLQISILNYYRKQLKLNRVKSGI